MKTPSTDIVRDMLDRLRTAFETGEPLQGEFWDSFEADIRAEWGGNRHYVHGRCLQEIVVLEERNRAIATDFYINKISFSALREKWGMGRSRLHEIIRTTPVGK